MTTLNIRLGSEGIRASRSDRRLQQIELAKEYFDHTTSGEIWNELIEELDQLIRDYFPIIARDYFKAPSQERLKTCFGNCFEESSPPEELATTPGYRRAFTAASAIRYIDDFIDEALWSNLVREDLKGIEERVSAFLDSVHHVVALFDPRIPYQLTQLPLLELHLWLNPTQEAFDSNLEDLIRLKALDMRYVESTTFDIPFYSTRSNRSLELRRGLEDYSRDFMYDSWEHDCDFNLFAHLRRSKLNPRLLQNLLLEQLSIIDCKLATKAVMKNFQALESTNHLPVQDSNYVDAAANILIALESFRQTI